jgi:hypothetical protein
MASDFKACFAAKSFVAEHWQSLVTRTVRLEEWSKLPSNSDTHETSINAKVKLLESGLLYLNSIL